MGPVFPALTGDSAPVWLSNCNSKVISASLGPKRATLSERDQPMDEIFVVCQTSEIEESHAAGFILLRAEENGEPKPWPILITRKGNQFYGFENNCPHQGGRLDREPGQFLDENGNFITCGKHHAQFDLDTGECFIGPCQGHHLKPISLVIDDGDVCVTGVRLAEEDGLDIPDPAEMPEVLITTD